MGTSRRRSAAWDCFDFTTSTAKFRAKSSAAVLCVSPNNTVATNVSVIMERIWLIVVFAFGVVPLSVESARYVPKWKKQVLNLF